MSLLGGFSLPLEKEKMVGTAVSFPENILKKPKI